MHKYVWICSLSTLKECYEPVIIMRINILRYSYTREFTSIFGKELVEHVSEYHGDKHFYYLKNRAWNVYYCKNRLIFQRRGQALCSYIVGASLYLFVACEIVEYCEKTRVSSFELQVQQFKIVGGLITVTLVAISSS